MSGLPGNSQSWSLYLRPIPCISDRTASCGSLILKSEFETCSSFAFRGEIRSGTCKFDIDQKFENDPGDPVGQEGWILITDLNVLLGAIAAKVVVVGKKLHFGCFRHRRSDWNRAASVACLRMPVFGDVAHDGRAGNDPPEE